MGGSRFFGEKENEEKPSGIYTPSYDKKSYMMGQLSIYLHHDKERMADLSFSKTQR